MRNSKGFTLIELLVVVAIIGILAAIAIPQFAEYRKRGYDSRANSDLRNAAVAEEAYFATNFEYVDDTCDASASSTGSTFGTLVGATCSGRVLVEMTADNTQGSENFTGTATAGDYGTGKTFTYDSAGGGMQP